MNETVKKLTVSHALRVLDINVMQADPAYQRLVKNKHKKIVANFNEEALGIPLIAERQDGSLWIVDGLQRITALRKLGKKTVRCEVFKSKGIEHEAEVFKLVNLNRTKLSAQEEFRALLTAQDPLAWKIKEAVESCGFRIALNSTGTTSKNVHNQERACKDIVCTRTLITITQRYKLEALTFMLPIIAECWYADTKATHSQILGGLCCFYAIRKGAVDRDRLSANLKTVTPHKIIYAASLGAGAIGNHNHTTASVIEKVYRKRIKKS